MANNRIPDGKKRGGAGVASLGGPLVMQVVIRDTQSGFYT
jgi:hypothetical protein